VIVAKPTGYVAYRGPSLLDGSPIVLIVLTGKSTNAKTGAMVQTYILRSDMSPKDAVKTGADAAICGDCQHRGDGTGKGRSCYVTLYQGPRSVYAAFKRGRYPDAVAYAGLLFGSRDNGAPCLGKGRAIRMGTYGDPAAVPAHVWDALLAHSTGRTGYTHQWRNPVAADLRPLVMASCDSEAERREAQSLGWRTFTVTPQGAEAFPEGAIGGSADVLCPASKEAGKRTTCDRCRLCGGASVAARSVFIPAHGTGAGHFNRRVIPLMVSSR
jgi:hypothetical protein